MRMWMVNPKLMCREHLLGEWRELKMFVGTLKRKKKNGDPVSVTRYAEYKLIEPLRLYDRYLELKDELIRRGYQNKMVLDPKDIPLDHLTKKERETVVPREWSLKQLLFHSRKEKNGCVACQNQYKLFQQEFPEESPYSRILI